MLKAPIGVFDSGLGGLSVLNALCQQLPHEDYIYVADHAYTPYGKRSTAEITERAHAISQWLIDKNCKLIVVACNTATTNAIDQLRASFSVPFIGIEPAIKPAALVSATGIIGVLATEGTLSSSLFHATTKDHAKDVRIITQVGHGLVELVEQGLADSDIADIQLKSALASILTNPIDHLVLGCTHYPFLSASLKRILPDSVKIVDCNPAIAQQTSRILEKHAIQNNSGGTVLYNTTAKANNKLWKSFGVENITEVHI